MTHDDKPYGGRRIAHADLKVIRKRPAQARAEGEGDIEADEPPGEAEAPARLVGHAATFDRWTTLYSGQFYRWQEVIRPGAFARAIREKQDVRSLFNHDENFVLGRTKSGTLTLSEDAIGLLSETLPPDTQTVNDLVLTPIDRGDVDGMSFAFTCPDPKTTVRTENADGSVVVDMGSQRITYSYDGDCLVERREILDADLYDVSPVTYPAYDGTDVALRALGPDIEQRAKAMDRPHARPAPKRESYRKLLDARGVCPAGSPAASAAPGRKGVDA